MESVFNHILVPVDFTEKNLPAIAAATQLAQQSDARITLLHVIEFIDFPDDDEIATFYDKLRERSEEELETLSDWSREQFTRSGLLDRVRASTVSGAEAEAMTLAFLRETCTPHKSPLCGNSVHTDRAFLWRGMRSLHDFMHYRNIDVSSLKEVLRRWYPTRFRPPTKANSHEALTDIRESVAELRYYRETFFPDEADVPS